MSTLLADKIVLGQREREPVTLLKALLRHLRNDESIVAFREQIKKLDNRDRMELGMAFEKEFNYQLVERIPGLEPTL